MGRDNQINKFTSTSTYTYMYVRSSPSYAKSASGTYTHVLVNVLTFNIYFADFVIEICEDLHNFGREDDF